MPVLQEKIKHWSQTNHLPAQLDTIMGQAIIDARNLKEKKEN